MYVVFINAYILQQYSAALSQYKSAKFGGFEEKEVKKEVARSKRIVSADMILHFLCDVLL